MSRVRSRGNTSTEKKLITLLREEEIIGWRRHLPLPGTPDFVFPKHRVAVFVHGCFWHGCPKHIQFPSTRASWWRRKLERNKARDRIAARTLRSSGWTVVRIWECDLTVKRRMSALKKIKVALQSRLAGKDSAMGFDVLPANSLPAASTGPSRGRIPQTKF
jgi:DNA mismatch endonuclease (patch repair protein)